MARKSAFLGNERTKQVYDFIVSFKKDNDGNSPTIREIGESLGVQSTSLISWYLEQLERAGVIHRTTGAACRITVVGGAYVPPPPIGRKANMYHGLDPMGD